MLFRSSYRHLRKHVHYAVPHEKSFAYDTNARNRSAEHIFLYSRIPFGIHVFRRLNTIYCLGQSHYNTTYSEKKTI